MAKKTKPLISVIISTRNEATTLSRLLTSIRNQTYSPLETIVVDNHSTDQTRQIARLYTKFVYIKGDERSAQRNFGAKKAQGAYVLFLDADMELNFSTVKDCVRAILAKKAVGVILPEDIPVTNFFSRMKHLEKRMYWNESLVEAGRFFERQTFLEVGGYNENLVAGEDWDLAQRIAQKGLMTRIQTPIWHHETNFIRELKHKMYYTNHINAYAFTQPMQFRQQSGRYRIALILRKTQHYLKDDPIAFISLVLFKSIEFILYKILVIYNSWRRFLHS